MASPSSISYSTLADKIWTGQENITDLKVYLDFITSLPIDTEQYRDKLALKEAIVPSISDDHNLDSILALHSRISTHWKTFNETTFREVQESIRNLHEYAAQGKEFHEAIKTSLQLVRSAPFQKSRPQLASIVSDTIKGDTAELQQRLDSLDQLIRDIEKFDAHEGHNVSLRTTPSGPSLILSSNVKELRRWTTSVNELPASMRYRVLRNSEERTWVPFVGLVYLGLLESLQVAPIYNTIKECLKSDDSNMAVEKLRSHARLVEETLYQMDTSLKRTVELLKNIKALYLCIKQSLDAVQEKLAQVTTSTVTPADFDFNPQTDAFEKISERAKNFLTCFSVETAAFYDTSTLSAIETDEDDDNSDV